MKKALNGINSRWDVTSVSEWKDMAMKNYLTGNTRIKKKELKWINKLNE